MRAMQRDRERGWRAVCAALALAMVGACGGQGGDGPRPHVVVIIADDLGWGDVGFTGGDLATPRLDGLARESLVLERFYAAPMCSPARAQLMTGKHALRLGVVRNFKPDDVVGLVAGEVTVAERLVEAGYSTALVGKWHLGHARPGMLPGARGFQASYGHLRGWIDYTTHEVDGALDWYRDDVRLDEPGYSTDLIAAEAARVIGRQPASSPLFLVVSFNAPHAPLQGPPGVEVGVNDTGNARATYAAMVARLDAGVGRVLDALDERGITGETLVWFLSDNGANERFGGSNAPLAGGKYTCQEGALRVPALVRWPGRLSPGRSAAVVATVDVAPSVEALAGLTRRGDVDGLDVLGALQSGARLPTRDLVFAVDHARVQRRALLRWPLKLTRETRDGEPAATTLFDVAEDPLERVDLAGAQPEDVRELTRALDGIR